MVGYIDLLESDGPSLQLFKSAKNFSVLNFHNNLRFQLSIQIFRIESSKKILTIVGPPFAKLVLYAFQFSAIRRPA